MLCFLTCGPFFLMLAAWASVFSGRRQRLGAAVLTALCVTSANAAFSAGLFLYYHCKPPSPVLPPWQDPEVLSFGLLCLFAPAGMILGFAAALRGAPKWLIFILEIASVPMLVVGLFASAAV